MPSEQQSPTQATPAVKQPVPTTEAQGEEYRDRDEGDGEAVRGWIEAGAAVVIAAFTVILAVGTIALWIVTWMTAKAAHQSAFTLAASEMAHILMERVTLTGDLVPGQPSGTKFKVQIGNFGRTPGFVRSVTLNFAPGARNEKIERIGFDRGGTAELGFYLAANVKHPTMNGYGSALDGQEVSDLLAGRQELFVRGAIEFGTIFGETWLSRFAFRVNFRPKAKQKNVHVGGPAFWRYEQKTG